MKIRFAILASAILAVALVLAGSAAPKTAARKVTDCMPLAYTPYVYISNKTGYAYGTTYNSCPIYYQYYWSIQLWNDSGGQLDEKHGWATGEPYFIGNTVSCAGANVKSTLYINDDGAGRSHTSGLNSDCTY